MIQLDDSNRQQIEGFLPPFRLAIQDLSETNERITDFIERDQKNAAQFAALAALDTPPTDKQLHDRIICRERERVLNELRQEQEKVLQELKRNVAVQLNDGANLFRAAASKQLFDAAETELRNSLPASVIEDQSLTFRLLSESNSKRNVARFLNSFSATTQRDDADVIIGEAERLAQLLDDLINEREIAVPGNTSPIAASTGA